MNHLTRLLGVLSALLMFSLSGCSDDPAGNCTSSGDCDRGLACVSGAVCGEYACDDNSDCVQDGTFNEACLQEDAEGNYDPSLQGLCSDIECGGRGAECPAGQTCYEGLCYNGAASSIPCECSDDCPSDQACFRGECGAPLGVCDDDCNCPVGQSCDGEVCIDATDACEGVTCDAGETCVDGDCVSDACDPPCVDGETCNEATGVCESASGALCSECSSNSDCGGEADACIALRDEAICARSCAEGTDPCPAGFRCLFVDTRSGDQCVPTGGTCAGCLADGCPAGQYCNPFTGDCGEVADVCAECAIDEECGDGASCATSNGVDICLTDCEAGDDCGDGFTCRSLAGRDVCAPDGDDCGTAGACDLTADDCVAPRSVLDSDLCACVECAGDGDCADGLVCSAGGDCVGGGRPCTTTAECDGGYCQGGFCVDCLTPGDCGPDEICQAGECVPCDCPPGQECSATGECREIPDPSDCSSDSECVGIARDLGFSGEGAACDDSIGCYTIGACNGGGGDDLGLGDLGFGGETDPFGAPCPAGLACSPQLDILNPSLFFFACSGCTVGDDSTCRAGETCTAPLLPLLSDEPFCSGSSGGGFPFPFP